MPQMGFDMSEGTVARWLKEEGARVEDGEPVAEIETDKAIVEFESYASGILHHIVVPEGVPVRVGETIAVVGEADEDVPKPTFDAQPPEPQPASPLPPTIPPPVEPKHEGPAPRSDEVRTSPVARRLAEEMGIDLSTITGTGPLGRIIREDVLAAGPQAEAEESATPSSAATIMEPPVDESPVTAAIEPEVPVDESPVTGAIELEVSVDESPAPAAIEPEVSVDESPVTAAVEPEPPADEAPVTAAIELGPPADGPPAPAAIEPDTPADESPVPAAIEPEVPADESPVTAAIEPEVPADESPVTAAIEPEVPADESPVTAAIELGPPVDESPAPAAIEPEPQAEEAPAPATIEPDTLADEAPAPAAIELGPPTDEASAPAAIEPGPEADEAPASAAIEPDTVADETPVTAAVEPESPADEPSAPPADETPAPAVAETEPTTVEDVPDDTIPLSRMRQQIARVTVRSKAEKPHFYLTCDIDMTRAMELRRQLNDALEAQGERITVNDLVIKACAKALEEHPKFNAVFHGHGIRMNERINIGVAVAEEESLIIPAIMDCAGKSLRELAVASRDLSDRARSGTLRPDEYSGGTFAISNLGMFDVTSFAAIIQPPQSAVLAVGSVTRRPAVFGDDLGIADVMTATLSADHRIVDGVEGARFMMEIKRLLESPLALLDVDLS